MEQTSRRAARRATDAAGEIIIERRTWIKGAAALVVVVLVAGGSAAGACKFALNCGIRGDASTPSTFSEAAASTGSTALPAGVTEDAVATGLRYPTSFDFLPDGRLVVAEREGRVVVVEDGTVRQRPLLDLRGAVATAYFRGVVGMAVDPAYDANHFIYILYSRAPDDGPGGKGPTTVRLSRFRVQDDVARLDSEHPLLGAVEPPHGSCTRLPSSADCLPSDVDHIGGSLVFAADGTLFVSTGEGGGKEEVEAAAFRAQDVNALGGKVLRITADGLGLASNPFATADLTANRSKVWALGFRNPFRMTLSPVSGIPVVADVGWTSFDEVNTVRRGANHGWPCLEGTERTREYSATSQCAALYSNMEGFTPPTIELPHDRSPSVTGGVFASGEAEVFGANGGYLFGDWVRSVIRLADVDPTTGELTGDYQEFGSSAGGPVEFRVGPDGAVYYLALNNGEVRRISSG